jgi:TolB-like protein
MHNLSFQASSITNKRAIFAPEAPPGVFNVLSVGWAIQRAKVECTLANLPDLSATVPSSTENSGDSQALNPSALEQTLRRILATPAFLAAPLMARLLEYLAEETRPEAAGRLTAYQIALSVFGQATDFDPQANSLVRVNMHRLREMLEAYSAGSGAEDEWRLYLPPGSYLLRLSASSRVAPSGVRLPSLAVLRIDNVAQDPERNWFCDGMTLELVHLLTGHPAIRVVVPHTNFPLPKRMGTSVKANTDYQLACAAKVTDKGKKPPNQYHMYFTVSLADLNNKKTLWTKEYAGNMSVRFMRNVLEDITWHAWTFIVAPHVPVNRPARGKLRWKFPA